MLDEYLQEKKADDTRVSCFETVFGYWIGKLASTSTNEVGDIAKRSVESQHGLIFELVFNVTIHCAYVALHKKSGFKSIRDYNLRMFPLSIFTFCYSGMVAKQTIADTLEAYEKVFIKKFNMLMLMNFVINIFVPLALAFYGFILILCEKDYISAVLNCSALLFIPEIDDQLPQILGYREDDIIKNFLITESNTTRYLIIPRLIKSYAASTVNLENERNARGMHQQILTSITYVQSRYYAA